ncbi:MAG: hypothetical protein NTV33_13680 [Coprothermobacterota bacterium]|nr:hypothetical protein [Coprothermobacterota bacterium]
MFWSSSLPSASIAPCPFFALSIHYISFSSAKRSIISLAIRAGVSIFLKRIGFYPLDGGREGLC